MMISSETALIFYFVFLTEEDMEMYIYFLKKKNPYAKMFINLQMKKEINRRA